MAVAYLKDLGYRILDRNVRNKLGEIDIVAQDKDTLCFIEVKTRRTARFGSPFEAVTPRKQRKLIRLAEMYLQDKNIVASNIRFDCLAVFVEEPKDNQITLIKGAFEGE